MLENYHTHTFRCRHAQETDEAYVQSAIAGGLKVLGFSDHTPFLFPGTYYSRMRMFPEQLPDYAASILALKDKYAGQIDIHLGLEVEYYPDRIADLLELIAPYGIEYMILGQHWCGNEENEPHNGQPTEDPLLLERYCDQLIRAMDTGLFSYIAHPDMLNFSGDEAVYRKHMTRLCQEAKNRCCPLELNLLGLRENRHYPNPLFWEIAGEVGSSVVIGSDAHAPQYVVDPATELKAINLAKKYNLNLLETVPIHSWQTGNTV